jgi:dolichyl-phosphate-mannose--protein O-mannosyl transferase
VVQDYFWQHFVARAIGLILVPFIVYLSFFYVHFAILRQSGTGDVFMSPAFQETLAGNEMLMSSAGKNFIKLYGDALANLAQKFATLILSR